MSNTLLKLIVLGGAGYLVYKYYYLPNHNKLAESNVEPPIQNMNDGRTIFYGDSKDDYVRGFIMPENINEIKANEIDVITKPKMSAFNQTPRSLFRVKLLKDLNRVVYISQQGNDANEYVANYNQIKDKLVMNQDYTK